MNKSPYTEQEAKVMASLADAWNEFLKLPTTHPSEKEEFCKAIHDAQNIMGWRILRRDYPYEFSAT